MADLKDKYIVFGAKTSCSMGLRESQLVLPSDYGIFIRGKAQLHVKDKEAFSNIIPFGGCKSCSNPDTARKMGQMGMTAAISTFSGTFCAPAAFAACAGVCTPVITAAEWEDGNDFTDIDDEKALLGRCTLACVYGGIIEITDAGQD